MNEKNTRPLEEKEFYKSNQNFFKVQNNISTTDDEIFQNSNNKNLSVENKISDDFIKRQLEELNKLNKLIKSNEGKETKKFEQDDEIKINNLSEFLNKPQFNSQSSKNMNIVDDISLTSLNSDLDDKF